MNPGGSAWDRVAAIVNPAAARGKAFRLWRQIERRLTQAFGLETARFTEGRGHASTLALELAESGFQTLLVFGGDGTLNEILNGLFRQSRLLFPEICVGALPVGRGSDFRRSLGIPEELEPAISALAGGRVARIDLGRVIFTGEGGREERLFVNMASFGLGPAAALHPASRWRGGAAGYLLAAGLVLSRYQFPRIRLRGDLESWVDDYQALTHVAVGNGAYQGGGMKLCPRALVDDGLLEVSLVERLSLPELLRNLPLLFSADLYSHPKVHHQRCTWLRAESEHRTGLELDGEVVGVLPAEFTVLPRALRVISPIPASPESRLTFA